MENDDKNIEFLLHINGTWNSVDKPRINNEIKLNVTFIANEIGVESIEELFTPSNVNITNSLGNNALFYCQNLEIAKQLCNTDIDINHSNKKGETALHVLCRHKNCSEVIDYLLQRGADSESFDDVGNTPLHEACTSKQLQYVQILLYHGASTTVTNDSGKTPLMVAVEKTDGAVIQELWPYLDEHEIDKASKNGYTLLMYLLQSKQNVHLTRALLHMSPDVDVIAKDRRSALYWSLFMDDSQCFDLIWPRIRDPQLLKGIMLTLFRFCRFRCEREFVDCLFKILESPHIFSVVADYNKSNVIQDWRNYYNYSATSLLLEHYHTLGKDDFVKTLYIFLSYGAKVKAIDFWVILQSRCDFKFDILDIIIDMYPYYVPLLTLSSVLTSFKTEDIKYKLRFSECRVRDVIYAIFQKLSVGKEFFPLAEIMILLEYTSGSVTLKEMYTAYLNCRGYCRMLEENCLVSKIERILTANTVPSLLELSRDEVRLKIVRSTTLQSLRTVTTEKVKAKHGDSNIGMKYFFLAIRRLSIPQYLKDVLLYKAPIYNYDYI